jgi:hypothetical protein
LPAALACLLLSGCANSPCRPALHFTVGHFVDANEWVAAENYQPGIACKF